jgi:hypothetical protein
MALELAYAHAEEPRCFPLAEEQAWVWTLRLHVVVDRETVEAAVEERRQSYGPPMT